MERAKQIDTDTLRAWLEAGKPVTLLDIRPIQERLDWYIPGSLYFNAYDKLKANKPHALNGLYLDKTVPVVTFCAGGKTSLIAAELLIKQGYDAYSLAGGMKEWSLAWNTAKIVFPEFEIIQFRRTGKGCLSYLIAAQGEAALVDASLPIEVYLVVLKKENLKLKFVLETHIHADHLSRSKSLAEHTQATLYLPVPNKVNFEFEPITENTTFQLGKIDIEAVQTPGHTLESTCFRLSDLVLFSGDTLFTNAIGRPDLKADQEEVMNRANKLYHSLQKILAMGDHYTVLPAHTSLPVEFDHIPIQGTIGEIKKEMPILQLNKEDFVQAVLQRIPPTPPNYLLIVEKNLEGNISDINPVDLEAGANRCAVS